MLRTTVNFAAQLLFAFSFMIFIIGAGSVAFADEPNGYGGTTAGCDVGRLSCAKSSYKPCTKSCVQHPNCYCK